MRQTITYDKDGLDKLKAGIKLAANIGRITIGPGGKNVTIDNLTTNDGMTSVTSIQLPDPTIQLGVDIVKGVAMKTSRDAGDATTTSIILTDSLSDWAMKELAAGENANNIRIRLTEEVNRILSNIRPQETTLEILQKIAAISAESTELGDLVAEVVWKVGEQGIITLSDNGGMHTTYDIESGYRLEKGVLSSYMLENGLAHLQDVKIVVADKKFSDTKELLKILDVCNKDGIKSFVLICDDLSGKALQTVISLRKKGEMKVVAIRGPVSTDKKEVYKDIAVYLGAQLISDELNNLDTFSTDMMGAAAEVKADQREAYLISGQGDEEKINQLISVLEKEKENLGEFDKKKINTRIARLDGGYATINVGAPTPKEVEYLKLKLHNSVNAARNAMKYGVVRGGGVELWMTGDSFLNDAISQPFRDIMKNAGQEDRVAWANKINETKVVDSFHSIRSALQNAASEVGIFITTGVVIANELDLPKSE